MAEFLHALNCGVNRHQSNNIMRIRFLFRNIISLSIGRGGMKLKATEKFFRIDLIYLFNLWHSAKLFFHARVHKVIFIQHTVQI